MVDEREGGLNPRLTEDPPGAAPDLERSLHKTIKKVTADTERLQMNTAIAQMMIFVNDATASDALPLQTVATFLRLLAPYAPHIAEELWQRLGEPELIAHAPWPVHREELTVDELISIVVQVNGKKRDELLLPKDADRATLEQRALESENARRFMEGREPKRVIVVPGRLVNIVV